MFNFKLKTAEARIADLEAKLAGAQAKADFLLAELNGVFDVINATLDEQDEKLSATHSMLVSGGLNGELHLGDVEKSLKKVRINRDEFWFSLPTRGCREAFDSKRPR